MKATSTFQLIYILDKKAERAEIHRKFAFLVAKNQFIGNTIWSIFFASFSNADFETLGRILKRKISRQSCDIIWYEIFSTLRLFFEHEVLTSFE